MASFENPAVPISSSEVLKVIGGNIDSGTGIDVTTNKALGLSAVWKGVNARSNDIGKIPLEVLRREKDGGKTRMTDHPANRILRQTCNGMIPIVWKKACLTHTQMRGNAYTLILRRGGIRGAEPVGRVLLPPTPTTFPVIADDEKWYVTSIEGVQHRFRDEDVLHFPGLSFDGLVGMDVLEVMANVFGLGLAEHGHAERFFKHGTQTAGFLTAPRALSEPQLKDLRDNWALMQTGLENMHKPGVLHGGMEFKPLGIDPEKAQLLQSREFGLIEIANVLCMPPHKVGHPARTSYNSLEQENKEYLASSLDPWMVVMEQECEQKLLTEREKAEGQLLIEFNRAAFLSTALLDQVMSYRALREMGAMNANQVSARMNLPSQGDKGEQFYVPANWTPVGSDGQPAAPQTQTAQVNEAHRVMIVDRLAHLLQYERRHVTDAAKREGNFLAWLDGFCADHEGRVRDALTPMVDAFYSTGDRTGGELTAAVAARQYAQESKRLLVDLAGNASRAEFPTAVADMTKDWSQRAENLARWITET